MWFKLFFRENDKIKSIKIEAKDVILSKQKALKTKLENRKITIINAIPI